MRRGEGEKERGKEEEVKEKERKGGEGTVKFSLAID